MACEPIRVRLPDTAVHILIYNTFHRRHTAVFHSHHSRKHCRRYPCCHLQRTTRLSTVANHTGEIGNHVLHRIRNLFITSAHQPSNTAAGTGSCYHTTTQGRQTSQTLLDINHRQVSSASERESVPLPSFRFLQHTPPPAMWPKYPGFHFPNYSSPES